MPPGRRWRRSARSRSTSCSPASSAARTTARSCSRSTLTGTLLIGAGFGTDELIAREVARDRGGRGPLPERRRRAEGDRRAWCCSRSRWRVVFVGGYDADARLATLLVGPGRVGRGDGALAGTRSSRRYERLGARLGALIIQRGADRDPRHRRADSRAAGSSAAGVVYLTGALVAFVATRVHVAALHARDARRARPGPARWALLRGGIPIGAAATLWVVLLKVDVLLLAFLTNNARGRPVRGRRAAGRGHAVRRLGVQRGDAAVGRAHDRRGAAPAATCSASSCWRRGCIPVGADPRVLRGPDRATCSTATSSRTRRCRSRCWAARSRCTACRRSRRRC